MDMGRDERTWRYPSALFWGLGWSGIRLLWVERFALHSLEVFASTDGRLYYKVFTTSCVTTALIAQQYYKSR